VFQTIHLQHFGGLAQLVERLHGMQKVSGSTPLISTKTMKPFIYMCFKFLKIFADQ
jgi:hypothetical protein